MNKVIKLSYYSGSSDKEYHIHVEEQREKDHWRVRCMYGKRWSVSNETIKGTNMCYGEAEEVAYKIREQKLRKGYTEDLNTF